MKSNTRKLAITLGILTVIAFLYDFTLGIVIAFLSVIIISIGFTRKTKKKSYRSTNSFSFRIADPCPLLDECTTGEQVNWWRNPDDHRHINFYRHGDYFLGEGKLGEVPFHIQEKVNRLINAGHELTFTVDGTTVFCSIKPFEQVQKEKEQRRADKKTRLEELFSKDYRPQKPIKIRIDHHFENYKPSSDPNIQVLVHDKETYLENPEKLFVDFIVDGKEFRNDTTYEQLLRIIRAHHAGYKFSVEVERVQFSCFDIILTPYKEVGDQDLS